MSDLAGYEEEKLDQLLFRPLSHPVAVASARLGLTPNGVSVVGMLFGVAGGYFFQFRDWRWVIWGVALFCVRNVFDYADGQLARLTGKGTAYGYFFDGFCDYVAYASVYAFAVVGLWPEYGALALLAALVAAWLGALYGSSLDYCKREYRFWALGSDEDRFRTAADLRARRAAARGFDRLLLLLAAGYAALQARFTPARRALLDRWMPHRSDPAFRERYSRWNRWTLRALFLVGPNWQAYLFFVFGLLGRMDLYFLTHVGVLGPFFLAVLIVQRTLDHRLV